VIQKFYFIFLLFGFSPAVHAAVELKTGDILLQSLPCFMCSIIEIEEGAPYSHAGIYLKEGNEVIQAWGDVTVTPLDEFIHMRKSGTLTTVMRSSLDAQTLGNLTFQYQLSFKGHSYDPDFSWTNEDAYGEKYYCSELIAKMFNVLQPGLFKTKAMHFTHYRGLWLKYFLGKTPPDGEPGVSPGDIFKNPKLKNIGSI
jgi:hypothetical protein